MTITEFLRSLPNDEARVAFASRCGTKISYLTRVHYGYRTASADLCINLERESKRKIICEDLRPDVDWRYIRQSKAPRGARQ